MIYKPPRVDFHASSYILAHELESDFSTPWRASRPIRAEAVPALLALLDHPDPVVRQGVAVIVERQRDRLRAADARAASWLDFELARHRALGALDDAAPQLAAVMPTDRDAAAARLRGVAYGLNAEVERAGDEAPFDWRTRSYSPRE